MTCIELPVHWKWSPDSELSFDLAEAMTTIMGIRSLDTGRFLAERILDRYGADTDLTELTVSDLCRVPGIGPVRAGRLAAAFEFSRWMTGRAPGESVTCELLRLRARVPLTETILLGHRPYAESSPTTLSVGVGFVPRSPVGGYVAQLLSQAREGWWVVLVRPAAAPTATELRVAERFAQAAKRMNLGLERLIIVGRSGCWDVAQNETLVDSSRVKT